MQTINSITTRFTLVLFLTQTAVYSVCTYAQGDFYLLLWFRSRIFQARPSYVYVVYASYTKLHTSLLPINQYVCLGAEGRGRGMKVRQTCAGKGEKR